MRNLILVITALFMVPTVGCSSNNAPELEGFQAFHANAAGDGWRGPIRSVMEAARADADNHARMQGIERDELMVLAIYKGMNTEAPVRIPPNPLARRKLEKPVSLNAITGYWEIIDRGPHANNAVYFLDIHSDGKCKTDYGARFTGGQSDADDTVEVVNDSAFLLSIAHGESYVFSVTRFDGDVMDVLLDGYQEQSLSLSRKPQPSGVSLPAPTKEQSSK